MKRHILAMMIAASFALAGCEDKQTQAKLQSAEQSLVQLKAVLEKSQEELKSAQDELNQLKANVPSLNVKSVTLFEQGSHVLNGLETGYDWLDNLLYQQLVGKISLPDNPEKENQIKALATNKEKLIALIQHNYQSAVEGPSEFQLNLQYLGQRNNVISFVASYDTYSGGAHGMHWSKYIHVDSDSKTVIGLEDLVSKEAQRKLKKALWESYKEYRMPLNDFDISPDFYFSHEGIKFVYPPYAIGSYAEGEITLTLYWWEAKDLINKKYLW